jgi:hypothetical protein
MNWYTSTVTWFDDHLFRGLQLDYHQIQKLLADEKIRLEGFPSSEKVLEFFSSVENHADLIICDRHLWWGSYPNPDTSSSDKLLYHWPTGDYFIKHLLTVRRDLSQVPLIIHSDDQFAPSDWKNAGINFSAFIPKYRGYGSDKPSYFNLYQKINELLNIPHGKEYESLPPWYRR